MLSRPAILVGVDGPLNPYLAKPPVDPRKGFGIDHRELVQTFLSA